MRQHELKLPTASIKQQSNAKIHWNSTRSRESADFYTVGYSGQSIDEFVACLNSSHVNTLLDVRTHAVSMYKPAFSKSNLRDRLALENIIYEHLPELGVPRDIRAKAIGAGTRNVIWRWYDQHVAEHYIGANLHQFLNSYEHPIAFMCSELDPQECHRHRLAIAIERLGLKSFDL